MNTSELEARLLRRTPSKVDFLYGEEGNKLVNPDGPDAAAALSTQRQRIEALEAENARLREALKRCATIVDRNLYRQHEKVEDVPKIARQALGEG